LGETPGNP